MTTLARPDTAALWKVPEAEVKLDRETFAKGMTLLGSVGRVIDEAGLQAFWLAVAEFPDEDFAVGVRTVLKTARFLSPAALVTCCEDARAARLNKVWQEQARAEAQEERRQATEREAERAKMADEVAAFPTLGPPADGVELIRRARLVAESTRTPFVVQLAVREAIVAADLAAVDVRLIVPDADYLEHAHRIFTAARGQSIEVRVA